MKKINFSRRAILIISLAAAAFLYGININHIPIGIINDDAYYVNAARWFAGAQTIQKPGGSYPLGYSLMLIPAAKLFPESLKVFKVYNIFLFLLIITVLFRIFKNYLTKKELLFFLLLSALNPLMVSQSSIIMSGGAFLLILFTAFYFIRESTAKEKPPYGILLSAAFFSAYLCLIRFEGFLFAAAVILGLLLLKKYRHALYFTFFYVVLAAFYMHAAGVFTRSGGRYFNIFFNTVSVGGILDLMKKTSLYYFIEFTYSIFLTKSIGAKLGKFAIAPAIMVLGVFIAGFTEKKKYEGEMILKIYFVLYVAVHSSWPGTEPRYFMPVLPLIIFYFLRGAGKFGRKTQTAVFVSLFVFFLYAGIKKSNARCPALSAEAFDFIKTNTSSDAVFTSIYADRLFLYTNRKSAYPHVIRKNDDIFYSLSKTGADYIYVNLFYAVPDFMNIFREKYPQKIIIQCMDNKDLYTLVYKNENKKTAIWRVNPGLKENFLKANDFGVKTTEFFNTGDFARAKEFYAKSLDVFPYYAEVANNYALIYITEGNFEEAEKILIDGIQFAPHSAMLYALYGQLCKMKGEYQKSAENYKKALKFADDFNDERTKRTAESELRALGAWPESHEK